MALSDVEQRLLDGFAWLASCSHEAQHRPGPPGFRDCTFKTCHYAADVVTWCEQRASIIQDETTV